ncbi:MAG: Phosphate metabolism transcription protein [Stictis urceolatum]|nr:Phosphate metabolism transcription protein [Stictis urceolata]
MKFGTNLRRSVYQPWKDRYLDYSKLKQLLREEDVDSGAPWTEEDEGKFVDELLNVELEKVNSFQVEQHKQLRERTSECETKLDNLIKQDEGKGDKEGEEKGIADEARKDTLNKVLDELDAISKEMSELEKFSRINFTGALKAAKKHDKRRGNNYRVRPLLQVRLASLPFNSEDYSPLLYKLSTMYTFVRQNLEGKGDRTQSISETASRSGGERYRSYKYFVHPENLLEVKTYILRHLPVLVYTPNSVKNADGGQGDPTITSLYFDNPRFSLYQNKVDKRKDASSLRIQWFGQLADKSDLVVEKKTMKDGDDAEIARLNVKSKYVLPFVKGEYKMQKSVQKIRERKGEDVQEAKDLEDTAECIQKFIQDEDIQPLLRTNYTRTAFQIPGEDRVRISIDTNLALIREDALDPDRPCRDPEDWHRSDIGSQNLEYPFNSIRKGEISRFPYAVLEIKVRDGAHKKKHPEWVDELMSSHLVKEAPRFSKFAQGVASLFEDYINTFPFWMPLLDTDIRRDPNDAFEEEQAKKAKRAEDEIAVGSLVGSAPKSYRPAASSPSGKSAAAGMAAREAKDLSRSRGIETTLASSKASGTYATAGEHDSDDDGPQASSANGKDGKHTSTLKSLFPSFSTSKYARARRASAFPNQPLPKGVSAPTTWLKESGPVRVEPKVWLANQRTFVKWQHISVLLATLALALYNSADHSNDPSGRERNVGKALAGVYTLIAVFAGAWGWWMFVRRSRMIESRSGRDFDNALGPVVVCLGLVAGLALNFGFRWRSVVVERRGEGGDETVMGKLEL